MAEKKRTAEQDALEQQGDPKPAAPRPLDYAPDGGRYINEAGEEVDANGKPWKQSNKE